jgi:thiamine-phosphate pyrophosphorylase
LLYVIIDKGIAPKRPISNLARRIKDAGAGIIQLRDKTQNKNAILIEALNLKNLLSGSKTIFIVNDHADIAMIADADGLHLGQKDLPLKKARNMLGKDKLIGISCHSLKQALKAQNDGADYIGIGPVFPTALKSERKPIGTKLIKQVSEKIRIPFFVIGNINSANIDQVIKAGAKRIAVCRAVLESKNIFRTIKAFNHALRA